MVERTNPKTLLIMSVLFVAIHCANAVGRRRSCGSERVYGSAGPD
jgi:hypothetical protein